MIAIPNTSKPKSCWECFNADCNHWGEYGYDNSDTCPLIEIDDEAIDIAQDIMDGCKELKERVNKDLVRCGECRWCDDKGKGRALICTNPYIDMDIHPSYFCPYGERRADEDI